jgi:hypothetical protein
VGAGKEQFEFELVIALLSPRCGPRSPIPRHGLPLPFRSYPRR